MTNEVIGIGPLEGWTAQDFFDELKAVRAVVCSCASTAQERQDAITRQNKKTGWPGFCCIAEASFH